MSRLQAAFQSLENRNFRLFFFGQLVSTTGTWMQKVAQAWLVLELTGSGTLLGVTAALQSLPTLLIGAWGGLIADRMDKRRLLLVTQTTAAGLALVLGILTGTGQVELWMVLALALALGFDEAFDRPARKSFIIEMVGPHHVANAVTLSTVINDTARTIGPAIAGVLIAQFGMATSFFVNALSYGAVTVGLLLMRPVELLSAEPVRRARGQLRAGFRYIRESPQLAGPIMVLAVAGLMLYEWQVTLPLLARDAFGGGAETFGLLFSAMGLGAVVSGLGFTSRLVASMDTMLRAAGAFAAVALLVAVSPTLPVGLMAMTLLGATSITFKAQVNALLQLGARPEYRGRVLSSLSIANAGMTPLGAPLVGWIGESFGGRAAIGTGAVVVGLVTFLIARYLPRSIDDNRH